VSDSERGRGKRLQTFYKLFVQPSYFEESTLCLNVSAVRRRLYNDIDGWYVSLDWDFDQGFISASCVVALDAILNIGSSTPVKAQCNGQDALNCFGATGTI
jgi:hypothetical protein